MEPRHEEGAAAFLRRRAQPRCREPDRAPRGVKVARSICGAGCGPEGLEEDAPSFERCSSRLHPRDRGRSRGRHGLEELGDPFEHVGPAEGFDHAIRTPRTASRRISTGQEYGAGWLAQGCVAAAPASRTLPFRRWRRRAPGRQAACCARCPEPRRRIAPPKDE